MKRTKRLSSLDASFLYWEKPHQRMHVGCVAILDGPIPFDAFVAAMEQRVGTIPRYRERPVRPLLDLDWPHWESDPTFEVRRHLHHLAVPPPGGERELHALVDELFATRLDPRHPLWETYLVDGLADGRSAMICKVHHAMIDGVSGAQVLEAMADPIPEDGPRPVPDAPARRSLLEALRPAALLETARDLTQAVGIIGSTLLDTVPTMPWNGPITDARRIVWTSFPLDDFLTMRGAAGCKVNDVVLSVITGALRRYLEAHGIRPTGVRPRALVPVSVRGAHEHLALGNLVTSMLPRLPIDVADPIERLRTVATEMRTLKEQGQPRAAGLAMQLVGALPAPVNALLGRLVPSTPPINTVCTNVPGPRQARHLLGRRILAVHPMVPLFQGLGLEFAIMSYAGQLSIAASVEPNLVPDAHEIPGHLQAAAAELHAALLAGKPSRPLAPAPSPTVGDLMTADVITVAPAESLTRAYAIMRAKRIRHLPVVGENDRLTGLLSHRDVLSASSGSRVGAPAMRGCVLLLAHVHDVMETHVSVARADDAASAAGERMIRHKIGCLPVVGDDGRLVGIITEEDFLRWATTQMAPPQAVRQSA